ncbi:glycosyl transferase family 4 [Candidatus Micrarchaeota archaeon]|nr:glycosyl transferase family 4 [Candidatus Micrarchaeota archaeon]
MLNILAVLLVFIVSFGVTLIITPFIINRMHLRGITGKDMNKFDKPQIAEMGGIGVIFGFSIGIITSIFVSTYIGIIEINLTVFMAMFMTVILIGFIGLVDDLIGWRKGIRQWQHALFPVFAALPLMAISVGSSYMSIPFIAIVNLGIFYSLIMIPLGITGASNAFNMLAGMNGLEAGLGILIISTILYFNLMAGNVEVIFFLIAMLAAIIAFLKFNWFPAKIFPGDSLTLMLGATIATSVIVGNIEKIGVLLMALFFVELGFKAKHKFQSHCFGLPQKDGTLKARPEGGSLTQWIMKQGSFTEKQVTGIILGIQGIICVSTIILINAGLV